MSAIFGIFHTDDRPVTQERLAAMDAAIAYWGPEGGGLHWDRNIGLGSRLLRITPEDEYDNQPLIADGIVLVAHARLDNRDELCRLLDLESCHDQPDSALMLAAYRRYGEGCVEHLIGDWVFALWDRAKQCLLVVRDATGNTGLYWWHAANTLVFSMGIKGVLAHPAVPHQPNPLAVAGLLTVFYDTEMEDASFYRGIHRLQPGHLLRASIKSIDIRRWWHPENLPPLELPVLEDYYDAFIELYDDAVHQRLRIGRGTVASTLSGGLDSGSVVALAAPHLARQGKRLKAYVHTPLYEPLEKVEYRTGNEYPNACLTANHVGHVDAVALRSEGITVLNGIQQALWIHDAPSHAAGNQYWLQDVLQTARDGGARALLTAQCGNATVSYNGRGSLLPELFAGRLNTVWAALRAEKTGQWPAIKRRLLQPLLKSARYGWQRWRRYQCTEPWKDYSAIHPQWADELHLLERMKSVGYDSSFSLPSTANLKNFRLGMERFGIVGITWMEKGSMFQLDIRDPTFDRRIVEFCWRLPDRVFWGRGEQRALIRLGMRPHLPPAVLNSQRKGLQSADLGIRIQVETAAIRACLHQLESHALASAYVDVGRLQQILNDLENGINNIDQSVYHTVLARGLSVGLFLTRF